jgi:hypothetical protein
MVRISRDIDDRRGVSSMSSSSSSSWCALGAGERGAWVVDRHGEADAEETEGEDEAKVEARCEDTGT